jgi:flagellar hook-basal body complex protein FliE
MSGAGRIVGRVPAPGGARRRAKVRLFAPSHAPGRIYSGGAMSDLRLAPFNFQQALSRAGLGPDGLPRQASVPGSGGTDFRAAMADALKGVSQSQLEAQRLQRELSLDNPAVGLEETMLAMQKAQLGFQATLQVRNRLVQAYSDIMNMQV